MKRLLALLLLPIATAAGASGPVHYFPNLIYGHVLAGAAPSRYETTLFVKSRKSVRVHIDIFSDQGVPMRASFADENGNVAAATESFTFMLQPDHRLQLKIQLPPETAADDVAVKMGWATVSGIEELEVSGLMRITTPDGRLLTSLRLWPEALTPS